MRYSQFLKGLVIFCLVYIGHAVAYVGPLIMAPVMYLVRDAPAAAIHLFVASVKPAAFRLIERLKPVYRESWLTDGRSLRVT